MPTRANGLISADGKTYRFPIRKGVRFHDGSELTPEDVRYSFLRALLIDRSGGPSYYVLKPVAGVETARGARGTPDPDVYKKVAQRLRVDGDSFVVELEKPLPLYLLHAGVSIVSKRWVVAQGGWDGTLESWPAHFDPPKNDELYDKADGTGPFKLERWDRQNRQVVLTRFDGYWRKPAALKHIVYRSVEDPNTRALLLKAGDADMISLQRPYLPQIDGAPGVVIHDGLRATATDSFVFPFKIETAGNPYVGSGKLDGQGIPADFFADPDVRKAFALAFDYDAFIRDVWRGKGERPHGPVPNGVFGVNHEQAMHDFDPAKAAESFRKARGGEIWKKGFRFSYVYNDGNSDRLMAGQMLKRTVESLNPRFHIEVQATQWPTLLSSWSARRVPFMYASWVVGDSDPYDCVQPFVEPTGHYASVQGYRNAEIDGLLPVIQNDPDEVRRRDALYRLQAIVHDDVPQIYLPHQYGLVAMRTWVKGWSYNPAMKDGYFYPISKEAP